MKITILLAESEPFHLRISPTPGKLYCSNMAYWQWRRNVSWPSQKLCFGRFIILLSGVHNKRVKAR